MTKQEILDYFGLIDYAYNESGRLESLSRMIDELLKEQQKKKIKLIKKHKFTFRGNDIFIMWRAYEKICETLMDEGKLVISRTDDHEKVNFVWEIREDDTD